MNEKKNGKFIEHKKNTALTDNNFFFEIYSWISEKLTLITAIKLCDPLSLKCWLYNLAAQNKSIWQRKKVVVGGGVGGGNDFVELGVMDVP